MSNTAIRWAWSTKTRSRGSKCTLVCLADHANKAGRCWPSQKRMSDMTGASVDTIQRDLREFIASGLIKAGLRNTGNGRKSSVYTLLMPGVNEQPQTAKVRSGLDRKSGEPKPQNRHPKPQSCGLDNKNPQLEPLKREAEAPSAPLSTDSIEGKKKAPAIKQPLPLDWTPGAELLAYGFGIGLTANETKDDLERFGVHCTQKHPDRKSADWNVDARQWLDRFAIKLKRKPIDPATIRTDEKTGKSFVVPKGFARVDMSSNAGIVWESFDRYLRREANFGSSNFNPVKAGLPADFVLSRETLKFFYLVRTELPPEPLGKFFFEASTQQFAEWRRYKRSFYWDSEFAADLFHVGGEIMYGWWFDKESPPVWIDYGTPQWRAWDNHRRATRPRYDERDAAWLKANRIIDGENRTGFWSDSEWPPPEPELVQKAA
jgi:hypothetical protein